MKKVQHLIFFFLVSIPQLYANDSNQRLFIRDSVSRTTYLLDLRNYADADLFVASVKSAVLSGSTNLTTADIIAEEDMNLTASFYSQYSLIYDAKQDKKQKSNPSLLLGEKKEDVGLYNPYFAAELVSLVEAVEDALPANPARTPRIDILADLAYTVVAIFAFTVVSQAAVIVYGICKENGLKCPEMNLSYSTLFRFFGGRRVVTATVVDCRSP